MYLPKYTLHDFGAFAMSLAQGSKHCHGMAFAEIDSCEPPESIRVFMDT